jgi:putative transposase
MSGAPARRQAVRELIAAGLSKASACRALAISRSSYRNVSRRPNETELIEAVKEIRSHKRRWGYERVHARLRKDGHAVNRKRVERIWREQGFT